MSRLLAGVCALAPLFAMTGDLFSTWHMRLLSEPTSYTNICILQPDEASSSCDSPKCRSSFNLFVRKHHCRHCGHIFCAEHTAYTIPLDQNAKFHPEGMQSRACDSCYKQYRRWDSARSLCRKNSDNSDTGETGSATAHPGSDSKHLDHQSMHSLQMPARPSEQVASSVPKDWAWSTF
jgi:hypothetical protein